MEKRTKLKDRILPLYTKEENIFSMVTNIISATFSLVAMIVCIAMSVMHDNLLAGVTTIIYGLMLLFFYIMSSIYHGLEESMERKVLQVITHCALYCLIAGSYTPVLLVSVRPHNPYAAGTVLLIIYAVSILGTVFSAIDHYKYEKLAMVTYYVAGCFVVVITPLLYVSMTLYGVIFLYLGMLCYLAASIFYIKGHTKNNMHSVYQILLLIGTILQFIAICRFVI